MDCGGPDMVGGPDMDMGPDTDGRRRGLSPRLPPPGFVLYLFSLFFDCPGLLWYALRCGYDWYANAAAGCW